MVYATKNDELKRKKRKEEKQVVFISKRLISP